MSLRVIWQYMDGSIYCHMTLSAMLYESNKMKHKRYYTVGIIPKYNIKNKRYYTVRIIPQYNIKIVER